MFNRRFFLKTMSIVLLPVGPSLACSGEGEAYPLQTVPVRNPPFRNEPLPEFISRYVGHTNWFFDSDSTIGIKMGYTDVGTVKNEDYVLAERINSVPIQVTLPVHRANQACKELDVIVERRLLIPHSFQGAAGSNEYIVRSKIATWSFTSPGRVTSVSFRGINFSAPGRIICISRFVDLSGKKPSNTIVTVSREIRGYCQGYRTLVPSYDHAISSCDRLRDEKWSDHITRKDIEAYVTKCKEEIRYE